jgi:prepilin-type N-terminal cleavage/methylation domain-containing protein
MQVVSIIKKRIKNLIFRCHLAVFRQKNGLTLIELLVVMSLFVILMSTVTLIFVRVLKTQRITAALIEMNNNLSTALEQMAREVRVGQKFVVVEDGSDNQLSFINSHGECVFYALSDAKIARGTSTPDAGGCPVFPPLLQPITAGNIKITRFKIQKMGDDGEAASQPPPRITISFTAESDSNDLRGKNIVIPIQVTISSRVKRIAQPII